MDKNRLMRTAALAVAFAAFLGFAVAPEPPRQASPETTSLKDFAEAQDDFRGCDRGWNRVNDFWTAEVADLYTMTSAALEPSDPPEVDVRANDRDWCHVNDFWTTEVSGLYTMASAASGSPDPTIRLIELSVVSADVDEESPD